MNQFSEERSFELGARFGPVRDMAAEKRSEDKDMNKEVATSSADQLLI
jgi:hypothetical protein